MSSGCGIMVLLWAMLRNCKQGSTIEIEKETPYKSAATNEDMELTNNSVDHF